MTKPRTTFRTVRVALNPVTGRYTDEYATQFLYLIGTPADAYVSLTTTSPTNLGITIPPSPVQQSFYLTDVTATNTQTASVNVTLTDGTGSGAVTKEFLTVSAGTTIKIAYAVPKTFKTGVYAIASAASTANPVNISVNGLLAPQNSQMNYTG